ncbi:MAG TPA: serine/threonine protein phosphatase, partial [Candidatus Kerfeldbacteria bacterium]|nr:serine/threonine protein phosphatase [Candidatus Kerfeldbacteria bacterium]
TQIHTFTTQKDITNDNPLRVAVFGDSGVGTTTQYEVASEVTSWKPELILHTGDIAYSSGTEQEFIDYVFTAYSNLFSEIPFYGSIGNHDYTTEEAEPYKDLFETPANGDDEDYYSFNYDNIHFVSLNSNLDYSVDSEMYNWLEADLADTNKKWIIVFFHHPPYSSGDHGSTTDMQDTIVPLFEEHNVDLVLNGHDHNYERFDKINGVQYIVTGGGGNSLYEMGTELDESALFLSENHFVGLTISNASIELEAIDEDGFMFDSLTLE